MSARYFIALFQSFFQSIVSKNTKICHLIYKFISKANCVELKLSCGERDGFLRSKVPLTEIKNVEIVRMGLAEQIIPEKLQIPSMVSNLIFKVIVCLYHSAKLNRQQLLFISFRPLSI